MRFTLLYATEVQAESLDEAEEMGRELQKHIGAPGNQTVPITKPFRFYMVTPTKPETHR